MDDIISIDDPPSFDAEDWVSKKKDYSAVPYFICDVCTKAFAILAAQMKKLFPGPDISVVDLLKKELPQWSSAFISSKLETTSDFLVIFGWFLKACPVVWTNFVKF